MYCILYAKLCDEILFLAFNKRINYSKFKMTPKVLIAIDSLCFSFDLSFLKTLYYKLTSLFSCSLIQAKRCDNCA